MIQMFLLFVLIGTSLNLVFSSSNNIFIFQKENLMHGWGMTANDFLGASRGNQID